MRRLILFAFVTFVSVFANAQSEAKVDTDSLLIDIALRLENIEYQMGAPERYKLYKTENIYTFLKLDTKTGVIKLIQWNLDKDKEFETSLNDDDLTFLYSEVGQFELYPTSNMYQFLLLDKKLGRTWHVQWGQKLSERWIRRIY